MNVYFKEVGNNLGMYSTLSEKEYLKEVSELIKRIFLVNPLVYEFTLEFTQHVYYRLPKVVSVNGDDRLLTLNKIRERFNTLKLIEQWLVFGAQHCFFNKNKKLINVKRSDYLKEGEKFNYFQRTSLNEKMEEFLKSYPKSILENPCLEKAERDYLNVVEELFKINDNIKTLRISRSSMVYSTINGYDVLYFGGKKEEFNSFLIESEMKEEDWKELQVAIDFLGYLKHDNQLVRDFSRNSFLNKK